MEVQGLGGVTPPQVALERVAIPRNDAEAVALVKAVAQLSQQGLPVDRHDIALRNYLSNPLRLLKFVYFHRDTAYQVLRLPLPGVHGLATKISAITRSRFISPFLPARIRRIRVVASEVPSVPVPAYDPVGNSGINDETLESAVMEALQRQTPELLDNCIHYVNSHPTAGVTIIHCPDETLSLHVDAGTVPEGVARALKRLNRDISKISFSQTSVSARSVGRRTDPYSVAQKVYYSWGVLERLLAVGVKFLTAGYFLWNIQSVAETAFSGLRSLSKLSFYAIGLGLWMYRGEPFQLRILPSNATLGAFYIPHKSLLESLHDGHALVSSGLSSLFSSVFQVGIPTLVNFAMETRIAHLAAFSLSRFVFRRTILEMPRVWEDRVADGIDRVRFQLWPARPLAAHPLINQLPPNLRELDLSMAGDLQDHHLLTLVNHCPGIQKLTIGNRSQLTSNGWQLLARLPQLAQLNISIKNREGFGTLRRLELSSVFGNHRGLSIGLKCDATTLTHSLQFLDHLPQDAELSARIKEDGSSGISHFLGRARNLVSLRLGGWRGLTDDDCRQIAARHPNIRELRAWVSPIRISIGMQTLARSCERLEVLVLKGYSKIENVDELLRKNSRLRIVRLMKTSAYAMNRLIELPQLQEVMLDKSGKITDIQIQQLLESKPGLDLTIGRLSKVTPAIYQRVADSIHEKRQAQAHRLEREIRRIVERAMQIYDREQAAPLLQLGFAWLVANPPLNLLDTSLIGIARTVQSKDVAMDQLSMLVRLLPANSFGDLKKRFFVLEKEYKLLLRDPAFILTKDFQWDEPYFGHLWGCSFQKPILKSLLRDTPILQSSYANYLQEHHPRLDLAQLDEWYRELRTSFISALDQHRESAQRLGSISLSLAQSGGKALKEVFKRPEFIEPWTRFLGRIRTHADQHAWDDKERWAAAYYALLQNTDWMQEYLETPMKRED